MNHYETLGVARDATPEVIKAAFRRLARAHHPDRKTGNAERMAAVNIAFEVLQDPARRAHYDATGANDLVDIERAAHDAIAQVFKDAIEKGAHDWLAHAQRITETGAVRIANERNKITSQRDELIKRSGKIRTREGVQNIAQGMIDQRLGEIENQLAGIAASNRIHERVCEMLKAYEQDPVGPQYVAHFLDRDRGAVWSTSSATTGA